jgi:hypothetical protein
MRRVLPLLAAALVLGVQASSATAAPPVISVSLTGTSGDNGWYRSDVTVTWLINLQGETIISVTGCANVTLSDQPSNPAQSCAVTTTGGSASVATAPIKIDKGPPTILPQGLSRPADSNGWYNHGITGNFGGTDAVSGIASCSSATYTGPDGSGVNTSGTCRDNAGWQSAAPSSSFNYDDTPPIVTGGGPTRAPDANGWFNKAVVVNFTGTDATSGGVTCPAVTYSGPDGGGAPVPSNCRDAANNVSTGSVAINYDATGPSVGGSLDRSPDSNGWYNRPVGVNFSGSDNASGVAGCSGGTTYSGPDGVGSASGSCSDNAGNTGSGSVSVRYDSTAPEVVAVKPSRAADSNGWFNKPIPLTFDGRDAGSGVATCTTLTYAGPDSGTAPVSGSCRDHAGHTSAEKTFRIKFDATAPSLANVVVQVGNKFALLKWKKSNDVSQIRVLRTPGRGTEPQTVVFTGNADFYKDAGIDNGKKYDYAVTALDEASNSVEQKATAVPLPALYNPAAGARVRGKLVFEWLPVEGATYYNVQIWLGKRKLISVWPRTTRLVVPQRGKLGGKRYALVRGKTYRWYVWPGRGRKIDRKYGRLIGVSSFRYTR